MKKLLISSLLILLTGCDIGAWNNPYPATAPQFSTFYTAFTERPKHLDPVQAYSENEYIFLAQIYQPPLQYHYLKRPYTLIPQAAAALPTVRYWDKNQQLLPENAPVEQIAFSEYEIHLRPDLRFQPHPALATDAHGKRLYRALTAQDLSAIHTLSDFAYTGTRSVQAYDYIEQIKRLAHPDLHSPIFGVMEEYIVGLKEYAATLKQARQAQPSGYLDLRAYPLSGVEAVDALTYRIKIKGKYPQFAYWLAMPFFAPMPWEAEQFYAQPGMRERNFSLDWWPLGSGPYYLSENNPNQRMVLSKNPYFSGEFYPREGETGDQAAGLLADAGKPLPLMEQVVFSLEKETIPYWNKFLQGYYDASGISSDSFDQAVQVSVGGEANVSEQMQAQGIVLNTAVATSTTYIGFNWLDPVVGGSSEKARKLRRAIAIATDFEEFISIFANGRGITAQSPLPPSIFGHREGAAGINPYVYDWVNGAPRRKPLAEAEKLLAEAGYPNGLDANTKQPLVLYLDTTANGVGNKSRLDWLRKQFDKLHIQLVIRSTDYNRFQDKVRRGDTQLFYYGWNADYPDPENFLFLLYGEQGKVAKGGENAANYANAEYDRLFQMMKNRPNDAVRQAMIDQMLEILRRDSPWLWGFHAKDYVLHHAWLKNSKPNKMAINNLKYLRIDTTLRERLRLQWNSPQIFPLVLVGFLLLGLFAWLRQSLRNKHEAAV